MISLTLKKILLWFLKIIKFVIFGSTKKNHRKRDYILIPIYAIIIATFVRSIFFDHFHVPSGSMLNTLQIGDKIAISKSSYGYSRYSFPFGLAPINGRVMQKHKPQRGDIIVFKLPSNGRTNYVKRLIGLPGDIIRINNGILEINGKTVKRMKIEENADTQHSLKHFQVECDTMFLNTAMMRQLTICL